MPSRDFQCVSTDTDGPQYNESSPCLYGWEESAVSEELTTVDRVSGRGFWINPAA